RRRHTRFSRDWSSDVCSSDLAPSDDDKLIFVKEDFGTEYPIKVQAHGFSETSLYSSSSFPMKNMIFDKILESLLNWKVYRFHDRSEERRVGRVCKAWCCDRH